MRKSAFSKLAFLLLGFLVMVCLNSMRQFNIGDSQRFKGDLSKPKNEFVIDIAKCGFIKYYLQPNVTSVYIAMPVEEKLDKGSIFSSPKYTYKVKITSDVSLFVSQNSKKGIWAEAKEAAPLKLSKRGVPLNLELEIPRDKVYRHDVANAQINLSANGVEKTSIIIKVVNSKY